MEFEFATLDVFTNKRLEGNPLAVVKVKASQKDKLSQDLKQQIAKEFNLSETTFLHVPDNDTEQQQPSALSVDIFTIESELPFAGHPTIGTAVLAKSLFPSVSTLNIKAGPIGLDPYTANGRDTFIRAKIPHNVHLHARTLGDVIPKAQHESYEGLSHSAPEIRAAELAAPVFSVVAGMTFVLVELPSLELLGHVGRTRLDFDALPTPLLDVGTEWAPSFVCRYYYVNVDDKGENDDGKKTETRKLRTRMVELGFEDPATGSAASCLASYLTLHDKELDAGAGASFEIVQGVEMGRRSEIRVDTTTEKDEQGKTKIKDLYLGGEAVIVQKGTITVD